MNVKNVFFIANPQMENRQAPVMDHKLESRPQEGGKRKVSLPFFILRSLVHFHNCFGSKMPLQVRRKKGGEEGSVMKAEDIEGYRGKEDIDAILSFIEAEVILFADVECQIFGLFFNI